MKTKNLLLAISFIALLFTSCEKDVMDKGGTENGGMSFSNSKINVLKSLEQNTDFGIVNIDIINNKGEVIFQRRLDTSFETSLSINTSELSSGIYYIDIFTQNGKVIAQDGFVIK